MFSFDFEKKAFYTPGEVAVLLSVHPSTVREWLHNRTLFGCQISERITRIPLGALMEFLGEHEPIVRREVSGEETERRWETIEAEHRTITGGT